MAAALRGRPGAHRRLAYLAAHQVGGQLVEIPLAVICGHEKVSGAALETAWLATPVALEARLDHVRLVDRGLAASPACRMRGVVQRIQPRLRSAVPAARAGERAFILSGLPPRGDADCRPRETARRGHRSGAAAVRRHRNCGGSGRRSKCGCTVRHSTANASAPAGTGCPRCGCGGGMRIRAARVGTDERGSGDLRRRSVDQWTEPHATAASCAACPSR